MAPPSATETSASIPSHTNGLNGSNSVGCATHEPGLSKAQAKEAEKDLKMVFPNPRTFTDKFEEREYLKGRLVLAFRIFAKLGFDEGVAGHITLRDPVEPTSFWVNPFGVAWPLLKSSDLLLVNKDGKVVEGGPIRLLNVAAYMIHHAVHTARPDVNCVAHSHSLYGRAFCTLGRGIDMITQDSCAFYNDLAVYNSFRGIVLAEDEGIAIAKALGNRKAALLQNHGLLTCANSIEACIFWFMSLEKCCHAQLLADAAAGGRGHETVKIDDADADFTNKAIGTEKAGWFSAKPTFDMMEHESGVDYKW